MIQIQIIRYSLALANEYQALINRFSLTVLASNLHHPENSSSSSRLRCLLGTRPAVVARREGEQQQQQQCPILRRLQQQQGTESETERLKVGSILND